MSKQKNTRKKPIKQTKKPQQQIPPSPKYPNQIWFKVLKEKDNKDSVTGN